MFRFGYSAITFSGGDRVEVPPDGITVLVGPNNVGKSAALRELVAWLVQHPPERRTHVVSELEFVKEGSASDLIQWLDEHAFRMERADGAWYRRPGLVDFREDQARMQWDQGPQAFQRADGSTVPVPFWMPAIAPTFTFLAVADQRLSLLAPQPPHNPLDDAPSNPLQVLLIREDLEKRLSEISVEAFRTPLTLSRAVGANLELCAGATEIEPRGVPDPAYMEALRAMPKLQEQGDGMRSFLGLMLALITSQYPVVLVDEPEAFLHPPQARLLGRRLATDAAAGTQVFVATHDLHVLHGVLEAEARPVTVIRLQRDGDVNRASVLESDRVRDLWNDPLLRYSNALEGLFHRGVVACEADTDALFYSAVLDAADADHERPAHDLLFTFTGGKQRFGPVVTALKALDVPVVAVADFDLLRNETELRRVIEALGGAWADFESPARVVRAAVDQLGSAPSRLAVAEEIGRILEENESSGVLTRDDVRAVKDRALRLNDGWQTVKRGGMGAVPAGDPYSAADQLRGRLAVLGLFVVPVGELERWHPGVGGHGTRWVTEVLSNRLHEAPGPPRDFVERIADWF